MTLLTAMADVLWFLFVLLLLLGPIAGVIWILATLDHGYASPSWREMTVKIGASIAIAFFYVVGIYYFCNVPESIWSRTSMKAWYHRVNPPPPPPSGEPMTPEAH